MTLSTTSDFAMPPKKVSCGSFNCHYLMHIETYQPTGVLKNYISNYLVVTTQQATAETILPDTTPVLSFRYKGEHSYLVNNHPTSLPPYAITGLRRSAKFIFLSKNTASVMVKFKPCGAALFFKQPLHHFWGTSISLNDFCPRQRVADFEHQLMNGHNTDERLHIVENFLLSMFNCDSEDKLIKAAVKKMMLSNGTIKIKELAQNLHISLDAFEKRFRRITGTSPKQFSSIIKMKSIISAQKDQSLTAMAYDYGYFDQSHFIKDFKSFTGRTPLQYFKTAALQDQ
jgi:AraC-like DNA-binding protein